ncbi:transposase for insertion sequence element IS1086 [Paenibacillus alvei TS-15]|uniref:Transposase for insertion sequence element IS1086 n=1 Tax=Paenibacillus alvei TS-15 TaxID=1117108 RepID=S9U591_PAEAL|nr:hypothetical protein [Paenibacillus alvei]EPY05630.1 transposase for insertion sequence element IS1086 [Paenibacillus alvei TS-15]
MGRHHSLIAREIERGSLRACIRSPGRLNRLIVAAASSASVGNDKPLLANELTEKLVQVRKRETFGHWELDTVVSSRGKSKACVATFIERMTRHYLALRMPDRNAYSMEAAFGVVAASILKPPFQLLP